MDASLSPLRRARAAATVFSTVAGLACLTAMDPRLPAAQLGAAYAAVIAIVAHGLVVFVRDRVRWWSAVGSGPVLATASLGLAEKPATVALALSLLATQTLYGTTRMAAVRTGLVAATIPALMVVDPSDARTGEDPTFAVVPVTVLVLFAVVLRLLYSAMRYHQETAEREALMASTSRALLGSDDLADAEEIVRSAVKQLAQSVAGLDIRPADADGPSAIAGSRVTVAASNVAGVILGGPRAARPEIRSFVEGLAAQLDMVRSNHRSRRELYDLAHHDLLTALSNRRAFFAALTQGRSDRTHRAVGIMLIDLDDFKAVNDVHGHAAGDVVLVEVARRMLSVTGDRATVARFGGDEFAVLTDDIEYDDLRALAEQLSDAIRHPIEWGAVTITVGASIGIANAEADEDTGAVMRRADLAMYEAKAMGKNQVADHH